MSEGPRPVEADTSRLDRWWVDDPRERYWLEVSERGADLGVDLNAPTVNEVGRPFWSYDLLREVGDADIVFHYDRQAHAVLAWSWAVGRAWADTVVWAARGTFARGQQIRPHERPGIRVSLRGPFPLATPLTLARVREEQERLSGVRAGRPYFPFELGSRATRPMQGYLFKLPSAFVDLFRELDQVPRFDDESRRVEAELREVPTRGPEANRQRPLFRPRNEQVRSREAQPWSRDPTEVDRALSTHARVERLVAEIAAAEGWTARSFGRTDPVFDLLLEREDRPAVVIEVKSTTATNEEKQLRLALGQVLRYRQLLQQPLRDEVVAFIAVERPPSDSAWIDLCTSVGLALVWPANVAAALRTLTG